MNTPDLTHAISVVIPVMNETFSLQKTVDIVMEENAQYIGEILIVIHPERTTSESRAVIAQLTQQYGEQIRVVEQQKSYLGGAMQDAFAAAQKNYVLLMSSDLETDPATAKDMVARMQQGDVDIVATTRWVKGGGFEGYGAVKMVANYVFQKFFSLLYGVRLTDLTFGFRLYRREVLEGITWEELKHPFLVECLLKPLRRGARVAEVPSAWKPRKEGESNNNTSTMLGYLAPAWRIRWQRVETFTK